MSQQNPFDRQHVEESAVAQPPGLLEQFNLPPAVIAYLRKNQRTIWIVVGCIVLIVVAAALYNQYTDYREEKAASALTLAMQEEGEQKAESLAKVVEEFGSTSSGKWSRIELAHIAAQKGDLEKAIQEFNSVKNEVSSKDPLKPLVLNALGINYERNKEPEKALASFEELSGYKGFEVSSYKAMGRIFELQGQKEKALQMYKKSLEPVNGEDLSPGITPDREIIQAKINSLQNL